MKKWLISMMAVATLLLAGSALADGNITLSPDGSTSTDASVRIDGQTVTITQAGTYQIAGTLDDGALIVESAENAKITLVLGGVSIKNSTGAAIQIATADDVTIELAEGTTNVLQSGEEVDIAAATESEEASGGALQSKADLKIKGKGSLTVLGYLNNGIHCTKDLKIKNGNISVTALGHGIKGKNSVTVSGGTVTVTSGKDGITSDETENEEKGFVTIENGEIIITSAGDGVSAETTLTVTGGVISIISGGGSANAQQKTDNMRGWWDFDNSASDDNSASCKGLKAGKALVISGGSITIDAQDDALHTDGDMTISGGECILSTGDDGAHAALSLTVLDGKITVLTSYEGLEANQITLAGGELDITASDDGINANGGSDGFSGGFGGGFGGGRGGMGGSFSGRRNDTNNQNGDMTPPDNSNMQTPPDGNAPSGNPPTMPGQDAADSTTTDDTTDKQPVLLITGGKITVNADGDGLDSNGDLRVEGGDITINGPANGEGRAGHGHGKRRRGLHFWRYADCAGREQYGGELWQHVHAVRVPRDDEQLRRGRDDYHHGQPRQCAVHGRDGEEREQRGVLQRGFGGRRNVHGDNWLKQRDGDAEQHGCGELEWVWGRLWEALSFSVSWINTRKK